MGCSTTKRVPRYISSLHPILCYERLIIYSLAQYVDYASQEVVDQLKAPALILAENLPADVKEHAIMIVGRNGIGKSCFVNEMLRLAPEERLSEGISKTSHGKLKPFFFWMRLLDVASAATCFFDLIAH